METKIPLKVVTTFSGIGFQEMGIRNTGLFDMEVVNTCELDTDAIISYAAIHNGLTRKMVETYLFYPDRFTMARELTKMNIGFDFLANKPYDWYGLVTSVDNNMQLETAWLANKLNKNVGDISRVKDFPYCDLLTFSFPCLTEDQFILTKDGYKELRDVNIGDEVLTKSNTWHPVVKKFDNGVHETCHLDALGFADIHCTPEHKFYVREMYRTSPAAKPGETRKSYRKFRDPEFKHAKDLKRGDYFGVPVIQEEIPFYTDDLDFWYMIGYYVGDGYLRKHGYDVVLSCNDSKLEKLKLHLDVSKWKYTLTDMNVSGHRLRFANKDIYEFISKYIGTGSMGKCIPYEILALPKLQLNSFLGGYIDSDGNINNSGKTPSIRISSVNRDLIYGTASIIHKVYNRPTYIHVEKPRKKSHYIDGREIKSNYPLYEVKFKITTDKQDKAFYEDGYIWYPFYKLTMDEPDHVYNIEVEEDHSYIVNSCISANCTDISLAGRQAGMVKGETRSGLVYEVIRILQNMKELNVLPPFLLMENVDALVNKKNLPQFELLNEEFSDLGYDCKWDVINGKNCGVPQNRKRVFAIYWLKDKYDLSTFEFPKPYDTGIRLKDILQKEVETKYYITNERAQALIRDLVVNGKVKVDLTKKSDDSSDSCV